MEASGERGDINAVKKLVDEGANVNETDPYGDTALSSAALWGHLEIFKFLLDRGANVKNGQALINAADGNHTAIIKLLIEKGVDINARDSYGKTALSKAARSGSREAIQLLIDNGADIDESIEYLEKEAARLQAIPLPDYAMKYSLGASMLKRFSGKQKPVTNKTESPKTALASDVDRPTYKLPENTDKFAIVVGIEKYSDLPEASYADEDASIMKDHLVALGFPLRNIILLTGQKTTRSGISKNIENWLPNNINKNSTVFFYYSGHGAPDPSTGETYIVPFDGDPNYLGETGYSLSRLYQKLGELKAKKVIVVLDSCFSGAGGKSVLAKGARPLIMTSQPKSLSPNMIVLSATQGSQISTSSPGKGHGIFTYYYLKALNEGNMEIDEIYNYLKPKVEDEARSLNVNQSPLLQRGY